MPEERAKLKVAGDPQWLATWPSLLETVIGRVAWPIRLGATNKAESAGGVDWLGVHEHAADSAGSDD